MQTSYFKDMSYQISLKGTQELNRSIFIKETGFSPSAFLSEISNVCMTNPNPKRVTMDFR